MIGKTTGEDFYQLYQRNLIKSYTGLKIKFRFPGSVQYPNLPVRLDFSSVIFPLEGETFCTGIEFYLAMQLKCQIDILGGVFIPFKERALKTTKNSIDEQERSFIENKTMEREIFVRDPIFEGVQNEIKRTLLTEIREEFVVTNQIHHEDQSQTQMQHEDQNQIKSQIVSVESPDIENETKNESNFYLVVKELMTERIKYPKGSYMNLLYKFLANAGIGQMARGLNQKVRFDSKTNSTRVLPSGDLVSPLYAG